MPVLHSVIRVAAKPIPAVISPRAHAILDYITVGIFLAGAGWFWRRNKRAAPLRPGFAARQNSQSAP